MVGLPALRSRLVGRSLTQALTVTRRTPMRKALRAPTGTETPRLLTAWCARKAIRRRGPAVGNAAMHSGTAARTRGFIATGAPVSGTRTTPKRQGGAIQGEKASVAKSELESRPVLAKPDDEPAKALGARTQPRRRSKLRRAGQVTWSGCSESASQKRKPEGGSQR